MKKLEPNIKVGTNLTQKLVFFPRKFINKNALGNNIICPEEEHMLLP